MDLVTNALGNDFTIHTHQPSHDPLTTPLKARNREDEKQRANSDEEDKGLIKEELLKGTPSPEKEGDRGIDDLEGDDDDDSPRPGISQRKEVHEVASIPLQDFLILRIENGRDYFFSISANFNPTNEGNYNTLFVHSFLDINLMQIQKAQIEAISAMEEMHTRQRSDSHSNNRLSDSAQVKLLNSSE
jgi:hypothetical protein